MQIKKTSGTFDFDFTFEGRRIRRAIDCGDLARFLEGGQFVNPDANLGDGKEPISFYDFVTKFYLPLHSKTTKKPGVHKTDRSTMRGLARYFGDVPVHKLDASEWEDYKRLRLEGNVPTRCRRIADEIGVKPGRPLPRGVAASPWTLNRELSGLNQVLEYALGLKIIKQNPLDHCRHMPAKSRKAFWLRKDEIEAYLPMVPTRQDTEDPNPLVYRDFAEFQILTGARIGEGSLFNARDVDRQRREIQLMTLKKRGKDKEQAYRYLSIDGLGPRFKALLQRLKPHPKTGYYFSGKKGQPFPYTYLRGRLVKAARTTFPWLRVHDLRHTFAMHRAIVIRDFRQLQMELGHEDPLSVQSYLDNTSRMTPEDSIFFTPPEESRPKKQV